MSTYFRALVGCIVTTVAFLAGCSTLNDVMAAKESGREGTTQEYAVSQDQAWEIAKTVFRWEGSDAIEEHRTEGFMLTSSGRNMVTVGTVMAAWISSGQQGNARVTVVTKRRIKISLFTTLTEETFHRRFAQAVGIVKAGQALPLVAPPMPG
jgi:hypothetical protein